MTTTSGGKQLGLPELVAVLGAGTMGPGIALSFARGGCRVRLMARRRSTLERAMSSISQRLSLLDAAGQPRGEAESRILTTTSLEEAVDGAGLVIESVPEDLGTKRDVLERAERLSPESALLATDTSSLSVEELSKTLTRSHLFAGFHWFNPPDLVDLVEVVPCARTAPETVSTLCSWASLIGKTPVRVRREAEGFIANRLQYALIREAFALVETGVCSYEDVDQAVKVGLAPRWVAVGPFESLDLAGLDVHEAVARRLYPTLTTDTRPSPTVSTLVAASALGCKTGQGLYGAYDEEDVARLKKRRDSLLLALSRLRTEGSASA